MKLSFSWWMKRLHSNIKHLSKLKCWTVNGRLNIVSVVLFLNWDVSYNKIIVYYRLSSNAFHKLVCNSTMKTPLDTAALFSAVMCSLLRLLSSKIAHRALCRVVWWLWKSHCCPMKRPKTTKDWSIGWIYVIPLCLWAYFVSKSY